jgi:RNA polymerase sigma-70 factor (ECF subfamily)
MPSDDIDTIKSITGGETDLYAEIVDKYKGFVFSMVSKRMPPQEVDDAAQRIFIKAFRSLDSFSGKGSFKNWLAVIAVRECCNIWREREKALAVTLEMPPSAGTDSGLDMLGSDASLERHSDTERQRERADLIEMVLRALSPEDRTLVETVYFEGWKLKDAAAVFGWSVVKAKIRAMRARAKMRKRLLEILSGEGKL